MMSLAGMPQSYTLDEQKYQQMNKTIMESRVSKRRKKSNDTKSDSGCDSNQVTRH